MDTFQTYIKMCEKAEEIQKIQPTFSREDKEFRHIADNGDYTWLPRQDQLQEMIWETHDGFFDELLYKFARCFIDEYENTYFVDDWARGKDDNCLKCSFTSMEQLWLAFVMKGKYGKVWNGENWK